MSTSTSTAWRRPERRRTPPLVRLLQFLTAEAPETQAATIRAGRALLATDPGCYRVHDAMCRVGGVSHHHGATLADGINEFTEPTSGRPGGPAFRGCRRWWSAPFPPDQRPNPTCVCRPAERRRGRPTGASRPRPRSANCSRRTGSPRRGTDSCSWPTLGAWTHTRLRRRSLTLARRSPPAPADRQFHVRCPTRTRTGAQTARRGPDVERRYRRHRGVLLPAGQGGPRGGESVVPTGEPRTRQSLPRTGRGGSGTSRQGSRGISGSCPCFC